MLGAVASLAQEPAFAEVVRSVRSTLSVPLPFLTAGLARAPVRPRPGVPASSVSRALVAAVAVALVVASYGIALACVTAGAAGLPPGRGWLGTGVAALVVQLVAGLVGTGLGFLVAPGWPACSRSSPRSGASCC